MAGFGSDFPFDLGGGDDEVAGQVLTAVPAPRDMAFDPETGDLDDNEGDLYFQSGKRAVQQAVAFTLGFILGEWFLDEDQGLPYFEKDATGRVSSTPILTRNPNLPALRAVMRAHVAESQDVTDPPTLDVSLDRETREMGVRFTVPSVYGLVEGEV